MTANQATNLRASKAARLTNPFTNCRVIIAIDRSVSHVAVTKWFHSQARSQWPHAFCVTTGAVVLVVVLSTDTPGPIQGLILSEIRTQIDRGRVRLGIECLGSGLWRRPVVLRRADWRGARRTVSESGRARRRGRAVKRHLPRVRGRRLDRPFSVPDFVPGLAIPSGDFGGIDRRGDPTPVDSWRVVGSHGQIGSSDCKTAIRRFDSGPRLSTPWRKASFTTDASAARSHTPRPGPRG
jgi:hypothetical protein